jgi:hypothetical protein
MRHGDGAIAPSYNIQFTTDVAQGLVVGVAVGQACNDTQELPTESNALTNFASSA